MEDSNNITPQSLDKLIRNKFDVVEPKVHLVIKSGIEEIPKSKDIAYKKILISEFTYGYKVLNWYYSSDITSENFNPFSFANIIQLVGNVGEKQVKDFILELAKGIDFGLKYHFDGLSLYATWE